MIDKFSRWVLVILVAGSLGTACGGKDKGADEALMTSDGDSKVPKVDPTLCDTSGKQVTTYDLNRDNRPDVWKLFKEIEEGGTTLQILSCKQVDFDHDGKKDYVAAYDRKGSKVFEKLDRDFDGRFDIYYQYDAKSGNVAEAQFESGFDGKYDIQKVYDESGVLKSVRGDRNGDGKPDVWEQYVGGKLVAILYDNDYDNKVDRRDEIEVEEEKKADEPGPDSSDSSDSDDPTGSEGDATPADDSETATDETSEPAPTE